MSSFYLGVDIGGTKSHALIADENGRAVGFGEGGPGNHESVGWDGTTAVLTSIVDQAVSSAGIQRDQIVGAGYGIAGYDWPSERQPIIDCIRQLGVSAPYEIVNDAIVGLLAGSADGWGVALVAGTGTNCWGRDRNRREGRVTGEGIIMGEFGGATELVWKAIHAINNEWTMRGPTTRLSTAFMELVGATSLADFIEGICEGYYDLGAKAAPLIVRLADDGDPVARGLVIWAAHELGSLACGVARQLQLEALEFDVILVGSLYDTTDLLLDPLRETIQQTAPHARLVRLTIPPVIGGVLLGVEMAGINPIALRNQLIESTRLLRQPSE